jgi:integrase
MLLMALNTGQRRGDLTKMTWSQVRDDHVVYRSSKTRKQGIIAPLMPVTKAALEELRGCFDSPFIFVNPRSGKPIFDIRVALSSACERAGVERFSMHHLRHLATTVLLEATNGDRDLVKRVIGWSSMAMVDRYGHIGHRAIPAFENINEIVVNRWKKSECARRCDT